MPSGRREDICLGGVAASMSAHHAGHAKDFRVSASMDARRP